MNIRNVVFPEDLLSENTSRPAYFLRINEYSADVMTFLRCYFQMAVKHGAFLEKGMPAPTVSDIEYFESHCAKGFRLEKDFIKTAARSCAAASENAYDALSQSLFESLSELKAQGKNDSILKNTFIKFMCWLRRDIARALAPSKDSYPPKIICKGDISKHELMMLTAAVKAGCDVLITDYAGSEYYSKLDPQGALTALVKVTGGGAFPQGFTLGELKKSPAPAPQPVRRAQHIQVQPSAPARTGTVSLARPSAKKNIFCVNAWLSGNILADIQTAPASRGEDSSLIYTCYARINGAENRNSYLNDLYNFYTSIKDSRKPLILDRGIEPPSNDEISSVHRGNYRSAADLASDMSKNIVHSDVSTQEILRDAFAWAVTDYAREDGEMRRIVTRAVYLICWFRRYQHELFGGRKKGEPGCLIVYGGCRNDSEASFVRMIARCPADVLILCPDKEKTCALKDELLYERNFVETLPAGKFPREGGDVQIGTVAYYAERDLDAVMYSDSGIYRSHQYSKATSVTLQTMYEEIPMLWTSELKFRPSFSTADGKVNIPVIMAKISGVKNGDLPRYWNEIHDLVTAYPDSTIVLQNQQLLVTEEGQCDYTVGFIKNGKINKAAVKEHRLYKYGFLKEEVQDHILNTLEAFLKMNAVKDQKSGGYEYRIMHIILNMSSDILRMIQKFDFTTVNPKIVYINTGENVISRNDSVLLAFLSKLGFDIILYIPTGYQSAEKYFSSGIINCMETGDYLFDLQIPDLRRRQADPKQPFLKRLFGTKK